MPKKQPRNSFYFYMIDLREEQKRQGIHYANMQELAAAAGPLWASAPPNIRKKYEARAKEEKEKANIPLAKFTSTGISYAELDACEQELRIAQETELKDIRNIVKLKHFDGSILTEDFFLMDVNAYCKANAEFIIGESTILRFSLQEGIKDYYHEMINPGVIPIGYASDVKFGSQELGLEMPDESENRSNYVQILANTIDFMKQSGAPNEQNLPPIFCMPEKVDQVTDFIHQMCRKATEDETLFRIYKLDTFFFTLMNTIRTKKDEGFPTEALALTVLKKDPFKYTPDMGCAHHEENDQAVQCTKSHVKRWAYTVLDSACPLANIELVTGKHVPSNFKIDEILTFKEMKKERPSPSVAGYPRAYSVLSSGSVVDSKSVATEVTGCTSNVKKPVLSKPLRQPKKEWLQCMDSCRPAPNLSESDFPALGDFPKLGFGKGRGRGSITKLNN